LKKILVIQTASIGDLILATPVLEKLHLYYPEASIDLLVKKGNESLFDSHPFLHDVLVWDKNKNKYAGLHDLAHRIRATRYDLVVNIQRFASTGILTVFAGAKRTVGFDKNPLSAFFTKKIKHRIGGSVHEVQRNLELVKDITDGDYTGPRLYPPTTFPPGSLIGSEGASMKPGGLIYTISPASLWYTKQFPKEKWIELITAMPAMANVYLLGSKSDIALCDEIIAGAGHPGATNLAGKLSLLESAALMKQAKMNFTNDSAPMHLASAVDAPVTVVYCSTIPGFGFGPLSSDQVVVETDEPLTCRPCGLHGLAACPEKHFKCALSIPINKLTTSL
jgi:ADP-heptose:LPS heptosyltransferase